MVLYLEQELTLCTVYATLKDGHDMVVGVAEVSLAPHMRWTPELSDLAGLQMWCQVPDYGSTV